MLGYKACPVIVKNNVTSIGELVYLWLSNVDIKVD